jgi:hypothetical protein
LFNKLTLLFKIEEDIRMGERPLGSANGRKEWRKTFFA